MTPAATAAAALAVPVSDAALNRGVRALLAGNLACGVAVMVTAGALSDLARSLQVSVATAGQLVSAAAFTMMLGAPLLAAVFSGTDRRRLLALALAWMAAGHALATLLDDYALLLVVRAVTVLGAALFTPQAAAAVTHMARPERRGWALATIFIGWSISAVVGVPAAAYAAEAWGWRVAFGGVAVLCAGAGLWVWRALPDGVRPPALRWADWRALFRHPALMALVAVTACSATGQFTVFAYFAPYLTQVLKAGPGGLGLFFLWFGIVGLAGNLALAPLMARVGPHRSVAMLLGCMAASLALWPLAGTLTLLLLIATPWALGCFASNSGQQARLAGAAPAWSAASIALNSAAMYFGQAAGAGIGGAVLATAGWPPLPFAGLAWMLAAIGLSAWATPRLKAMPGHG
ncbi:MAG: MFS transporter [Aquabacterium sp.]